jgi:hypothetical protein
MQWHGAVRCNHRFNSNSILYLYMVGPRLANVQPFIANNLRVNNYYITHYRKFR